MISTNYNLLLGWWQIL